MERRREGKGKRKEEKRMLYEGIFKPLMDKGLSLCGLMVLAPLYALIAIAVFAEDPGPVFFTQKRVGKDGKLFLLHKFRSMKRCTPHDVPTHQLSDPDQYITGVGRLIRKYSLDELPQLFDILAGNMSIIGPRPALWNQEDLVEEREKYGANSVLPGLTGWAQINGRDELEIPHKARLDGEYVRHLKQGGWKALSFDIKCFIGTISAVTGSRGVVEGGTGKMGKPSSRETASSKEFCGCEDFQDQDFGFLKEFHIDTSRANKKKVLITGAGSYIGGSFEKYARRRYKENFELHVMDMMDQSWRKKDFSGYDAVLHVAGIAHSEVGDVDDAVKARYYQVNTKLAVDTAKRCWESGVKQFVFLSSMIIYGDADTCTTWKEIDENTIPEPANFYGDSKWQADKGIRELGDENFAVAILRLPMVYGRGSKGNYPLLAKAARYMPVVPDVKNRRSMIYIENLCEFLSLLILSGEGGIYFPQNREYGNTAGMVGEIRRVRGKKTLKAGFLNPWVDLGKRMPGKMGVLMNKVFGNRVYSQRVSVYPGLAYQKVDFRESVQRTERRRGERKGGKGKGAEACPDSGNRIKEGEKTAKGHILVISQYFYPENFRINDMAKEWVRRGYKVTVVTGIPNYPQGRFFEGYDYTHGRCETWNGMRIIRLPIIPRGRGSLGMAANFASFVVSGFLWKAVTDIRADYVFSFEVSPMTQVLVGTWYAKKRGIPHFVYVQDLWPENLEVMAGIKHPALIKIIDWMTDYIYKNADEIFTTSPGFVEAIVNRRKKVARNKVHYWPQYAEEFYRIMDREEVRKAAEKEKENPLNIVLGAKGFKIAFTGNIGRAQGLDLLPKTAQLLRDVDVKFVIVGDGRYQEEFEREVQSCGVKDKFVMIPRQPAERIPELLAMCDVAFLSFMNTELFEKTIPAKLQSYMACGKPILAAANGESRRIIEEAECGVCCCVGDPKVCAEVVRKLMEGDLEKMGRNGREYCEKHFGKERLMDEMDRFIRNMKGTR